MAATPRTTAIILDPKNNPRDALLAQIAGFDPNKACEFEINLTLIERDDRFQPRVRGQNQEQTEVIQASMDKEEQDTPIPIFLNPDLYASKPFYNHGGNHRLDALLRLDRKTGIVRYSPRITVENARRFAFRDNTTMPMTLGDELAFVEYEMGLELPRHSHIADLSKRITTAAMVLVPFANKSVPWIVKRHIMTTLHPGVQKMLCRKSHSSDYLPKGDGLLLAQIPDKDVQLRVATAMQNQSAMKAARILDAAIREYAPKGSTGVDSRRLGVGDAALVAGADMLTADTDAPSSNGRHPDNTNTGANPRTPHRNGGGSHAGPIHKPPVNLLNLAESLRRITRRMKEMLSNGMPLDPAVTEQLARVLADIRTSQQDLEDVLSKLGAASTAEKK